MSLGKTKSEIFLQTLLEAGSVFTLSVLGATAIGKLFSGVLQNIITGSESVTENLKVILQIQDIGMLFLLGGAVVLMALCCSILPILRVNQMCIRDRWCRCGLVCKSRGYCVEE